MCEKECFDAERISFCKTRYFCPSCHQKRVLLYGEWIEENVFAAVPHRQYVFTPPRLLGGCYSGFSVHNEVSVSADDAEG
jgi:hypothetical protein